MSAHRCRACGGTSFRTFCDLGVAPLANSFVAADRAEQMEPTYPLHARVCEDCLLVQLPELKRAAEIFDDYAYFSSYAASWLAHAKAYVASMTDRLGLGPHSLVWEVASNDGYLLQYFVERGVPVLGIEPAVNVARVATRKGVPTKVAYFGQALALELVAAGRRPDLIVANNVLAHVPDLHDFVAGLKIALAPRGTITLEFPHLLRLVQGVQFDTIYHEHFSYFSLLALAPVLGRHGLAMQDVVELPTQGGSLRLVLGHAETALHPHGESVRAVLESERRAGLDRIATYAAFAANVARTKRRLLAFLIEAKDGGKRIVGYGAPAKGNTLLNFCGIGTDLVEFTVDTSPHKQGRLLPGSRLPIRAPAAIAAAQPDYVLILPWNLADEIVPALAGVREWGGRCVLPVPTVQILP